MPTKQSPLVIPELLENIILHLPLRDILLCQRVDTKYYSWSRQLMRLSNGAARFQEILCAYQRAGVTRTIAMPSRLCRIHS
ncbi:hypothetical protein CERZMDRAFT_91754 [Cercospora zeae-maydis SCOH1-5]|uniref:F-box domain-containing protein n=1 Tax=Cercospora zeae-maydis SCOH1-5 TaxID=717836 RepID=A0A6A6F2Y3_9PEZI|nr:hypothetical protein CERZMDRAFT_91754 [Cercospora zeae-maydis SCOH1-5]